MSAASSAPQQITGSQLCVEIELEAKRRGASLWSVLKPLTKDPKAFLQQLERSASPRPNTIARVRAAIAGTPVPPPDGNVFSAPRKIGGPRNSHRAMAGVQLGAGDGYRGPVPASQLVDRDPCGWCGVRRDVGCRHYPKQVAA